MIAILVMTMVMISSSEIYTGMHERPMAVQTSNIFWDDEKEQMFDQLLKVSFTRSLSLSEKFQGFFLTMKKVEKNKQKLWQFSIVFPGDFVLKSTSKSQKANTHWWFLF